MSKLTEKAIRKSFVRLLQTMPFDKITVKDIVQDCGINRNTFYYHYSDIYDLLRNVFETQAEEVLEEAVDDRGWQENFLNAMDFALENKKAIYHIYNSSMDRGQLEQYLRHVAGKIMSDYVRAQAKGYKVSESDLQVIITFYQNAIVGMVMQWLDDGMKKDFKKLIRRVGDLQTGNIANMLERAEKKTK